MDQEYWTALGLNPSAFKHWGGLATKMTTKLTRCGDDQWVITSCHGGFELGRGSETTMTGAFVVIMYLTDMPISN